MSDDDRQKLLKDVFEASRSEDPEIFLQVLGKELLNKVFMVIRTVRVHSLDNEATISAFSALRTVLQHLSEVQPTSSLVVVEDSFYINRTLIKMEMGQVENIRPLQESLANISVAGITFQGVPEPGVISSFFVALTKSGPDSAAENWIGSKMFDGIGVVQAGDLKETTGKLVTAETLSDPRYLLRLYFKSVLFVRSFLEGLEKAEFGNMTMLQRVVHEFIDATKRSPRYLMALATIHSSEEYLAYHSVNVMILSLLTGAELSLSRKDLSDLGSSAILHDIGKTKVPESVRNKTSRLEASEWEQLKKSNTYSLMQLIRLKGFNESALRRMLVAYEHTINMGGAASKNLPTLLARIVAVAHCYDAMVTKQSYRDALFPNEAFKLMQKDEGTKFDSRILHAFFEMLTPYPVGTLVLLKSREVGLVTNVSRTARGDIQTEIKVLYDSMGNRLASSHSITSTTPDEVPISQPIDPEKLGVNPLVHFFPVDPA